MKEKTKKKKKKKKKKEKKKKKRKKKKIGLKPATFLKTGNGSTRDCHLP